MRIIWQPCKAYKVYIWKLYAMYSVFLRYFFKDYEGNAGTCTLRSLIARLGSSRSYMQRDLDVLS